jgi:hypothetical protein
MRSRSSGVMGFNRATVQEIILSQTAASTVTEEIRFNRRSEDLRAVRWPVK